MIRQRAAHGAPTGKATDIILASHADLRLVLAGSRFQLLELEFHLVQQLASTFRGGAEAIRPQLGDQKLKMGHHRLGPAGAGFGFTPRRLLGRQCGTQGGDLIQCGGCVLAHPRIQS
jgi:hypothetical protein